MNGVPHWYMYLCAYLSKIFRKRFMCDCPIMRDGCVYLRSICLTLLEFFRFVPQGMGCRKFDYQIVTGTKIRKYDALNGSIIGVFVAVKLYTK